MLNDGFRQDRYQVCVLSFYNLFRVGDTPYKFSDCTFRPIPERNLKGWIILQKKDSIYIVCCTKCWAKQFINSH